jgi:hypothetical protein
MVVHKPLGKGRRMKKLSLVEPVDSEMAFRRLEDQIIDVVRAAKIAMLAVLHDQENPKAEPLGTFAVEHVERTAIELRNSFFFACTGKAVRS